MTDETEVKCPHCDKRPSDPVVEKIKIKPFKMNGKEVDLRKSIPLTIGDIEELAKVGYDVIKVKDPNQEQIRAMVLHVAKKANPEIKMEDVRTMPLHWNTRIAMAIQQAGEDNLPF